MNKAYKVEAKRFVEDMTDVILEKIRPHIEEAILTGILKGLNDAGEEK
jgi:hypothetical protein